MVKAGMCELCSQPASSKCTGCGIVYYCTKNHQKVHWPQHKRTCRTFTVKEDDVLGRHLVATKSISRGDVVLKEKPLLVGPLETTPPVCLGCLNHFENAANPPIPCPGCGWPMCSYECSKTPNHTPECQWTKSKRKSKVKISQLNVSPHPTYACVLPLRYCYQKTNNPKLFEKLQSLESHRKERKGTDKYRADKFGVVQLLRRFYNLEESEFTDQELLDFCGVIQVNSHEVPLTEPSHVAIYWMCSMFEHSCLANCSKSFTDGGEVLVRAARDINPDEHLSICYTDPLWPTSQRRHHLRTTKFFDCICPRCSDPTEMGTYFSALRCTKTNCSGKMLPSTFTDNSTGDWICGECSTKTTPEDVGRALRMLTEAAATVDRDQIESCRRFLKDVDGHLGFIHECHYLAVEVSLVLAQLYGQSCPLESLTDAEIEHKLLLCRKLMGLTDVLVPAECRIRGVIMFELHAAIAESGRRQTEAGIIDTSQLYDILLESKMYLEKAAELLKYEPEKMPEGKMAIQSVENNKDLEKLLATMHALNKSLTR